MRIAIISGSNRVNSESIRLANFVKASLNLITIETLVDVVDLQATPLPLFDDAIDDGNQNYLSIRSTLQLADGLVLITPEWNGMASPAIKNLLTTFGNQEFGHKPALLMGVSSGRGGAFPVAELRLNSFKNNHVCFIPEQIIVRDVNNLILNLSQVEISKTEQFIRSRIDYSLKVLLEYTKALKQVRSSGVIDFAKFGNGMS